MVRTSIRCGRPEVHQSDLKALQACITVLDGGIRVAEAAHPDAPLFANVPGAGAALRPRLIGAPSVIAMPVVDHAKTRRAIDEELRDGTAGSAALVMSCAAARFRSAKGIAQQLRVCSGGRVPQSEYVGA